MNTHARIVPGVLCAIGLAVELIPGIPRQQRALDTTVFINTTADTYDYSPYDGLCSDAANKCSFRAAVQHATTLGGVPTISIPAGTYPITRGLIAMPQDMAVVGAGAASTFLVGDGASQGVLAMASIELSAITMRNFAGAIDVHAGASLDLHDASIISNTGSGAVWVEGQADIARVDFLDNTGTGCAALLVAGGAAYVSDSFFDGNHSGPLDGGAVCANPGELTLWNSTLTNNTASRFGGAVFGALQSSIEIRGGLFSGNSADDGGAIYTSGSSLTIDWSDQVPIIRGNTAASLGGAILFSSAAATRTADIRHTNIEANGADEGGGIRIDGGTLRLTGSSVVSNTSATQGGAISSKALVRVVNSTLSGNLADGHGGGLYVGAGTAGRESRAIVLNATISNNAADADALLPGGTSNNGNGGGVWVDAAAALWIANTILAGNRDITKNQFDVYAPDCAGSVQSLGYNVVGLVNGMCGLTGDAVGNQTGTATPLNPKLSAVTRVGGSTWYHAPQRFSPAVDRGNPNGCRDATGAFLLEDQLGEFRPRGLYCDVGAYESDFRRFAVFAPGARRADASDW